MINKADKTVIINEFARVLGIDNSKYHIVDGYYDAHILGIPPSARGAVSIRRYNVGMQFGTRVRQPIDMYLYINWNNDWFDAAREPIHIIAHELQHVLQYDSKKLICTDDCKAHFFNSEYWPWTSSYWDLPWEIEARTKEKTNIELFMDTANSSIRRLVEADHYSYS